MKITRTFKYLVNRYREREYFYLNYPKGRGFSYGNILKMDQIYYLLNFDITIIHLTVVNLQMFFSSIFPKYKGNIKYYSQKRRELQLWINNSVVTIFGEDSEQINFNPARVREEIEKLFRKDYNRNENLTFTIIKKPLPIIISLREPRKVKKKSKRSKIGKINNGIYFIQIQGNGPIKIGISTNIRNRLNSLKSGVPYKLKLLGCMVGNREKEKIIHNKFKESRINYEWFGPTKKLLNFIKNNCN